MEGITKINKTLIYYIWLCFINNKFSQYFIKMKTHTYNNYQIKKKNPKRNPTTCTQFFNSIVKLEPNGLGKTNKSLIGQLLFSLWVQCNGSDISNHNFFLSSPSHPIHLARDASSPSPQTLHFEHSITFGCCPVCVETSCLSSRENKKLLNNKYDL